MCARLVEVIDEMLQCLAIYRPTAALYAHAGQKIAQALEQPYIPRR